MLSYTTFKLGPPVIRKDVLGLKYIIIRKNKGSAHFVRILRLKFSCRYLAAKIHRFGFKLIIFTFFEELLTVEQVQTFIPYLSPFIIGCLILVSGNMVPYRTTKHSAQALHVLNAEAHRPMRHMNYRKKVRPTL